MTKTRKCSRCAGNGMTHHLHVLGGICLGCNGTGRVEIVDAAAKAERRRQAERRYRLLTVLRDRAEQVDGCRNGDVQHEVTSAASMLEANEPDRHAKMLDSVEADRTDAVIGALRTYFAINAS